MSILIKLYTLNIGSLSHVNYTSIKIFLSKRCIEDKKKSGCLLRNSTLHILYLGQLCESPRPRVTHCPVVRPPTSLKAPLSPSSVRLLVPTFPHWAEPAPQLAYRPVYSPWSKQGHHSCSLGNPRPTWRGPLQGGRGVLLTEFNL